MTSAMVLPSAIRLLVIIVPGMITRTGLPTYVMCMPIIFMVFPPGVSAERSIVIVVFIPTPSLEILIFVSLSIRLNIIIPNLLLFGFPKGIITVIEA